MPGQHEKKAVECASWWSFKLNEGEKHHSRIEMAASLFLSTQFFFFLTKENIVKFLIRQKETRNLETETANNTESRKATWLAVKQLWLSHPMTLYMELCLVLLKCISLMVEAGSSRGSRQAKQIILAMNLLLLLLLFSPLGQFSHSALSADRRL